MSTSQVSEMSNKNIENSESSSQQGTVHKIQKKQKYPLKNCYQVEIRNFHKYLQTLKCESTEEKNVRVINDKLLTFYPNAAEKILHEFFKLELPNIPKSWELYKQTFVEFLQQDIPESRIRKLTRDELIKFRKNFIQNIKYPNTWKQPKKGRNLKDLECLIDLLQNLSENDADPKTSQNSNEKQVKKEENYVSVQSPANYQPTYIVRVMPTNMPFNQQFLMYPMGPQLFQYQNHLNGGLLIQNPIRCQQN